MIQHPGLTFTLCLSALLLGSTALAAQGPGDLAAQLAMPIASNLAGARDVPRFAWIENAAGARRLATIAGEVGHLAWSPDGAHLLFTSDRGDHGFVALLDVATGKPAYLQPGLGSAAQPPFSLVGKRVAFISVIDPPADAPRDTGSYWSLKIAD